jgi:hypothetical protein
VAVSIFCVELSRVDFTLDFSSAESADWEGISGRK